MTNEICKVKDAETVAGRSLDPANDFHGCTHRRITRGFLPACPFFIFHFSIFILHTFPWSSDSNIKAADQAEAGASSINDVRSFLHKHCHDCHGAGDPEAGFRVDNLPARFDQRDSFSRWLKLFHKIDSGEMPPKDAPRPSIS